MHENNERVESGGDRKRVLCVVRFPLGGIRTYLLYLYPTLIERGYRFTFLGPADASFRSFCEEVGTWPGSEFLEAPVGKKRRCQLWPAVRRQLRTGRFSLVHSQGFTAAFHSLVGGIGLRVPQVVTVHDVIRREQFPGPAGALKLRLLGHLLGRADIMISVSDDAQENLLAYAPSLARRKCSLVTIPNGIDLGRLAEAADPSGRDGRLRAQLGLGEEVFLMGFLGRFMEQKGFLLLLDALELLRRHPPDRPYHLVAVGSGDYTREYRSEVDRRCLGGVVSFRESVPNAAEILRQIDLLVMPSLWEAGPLLPMEAMALGLPVLGSDCIGLREVLRDTPSLVCPTNDARALGDCMEEAITRPRSELARAFIPEARRRFNAEIAAGSLFDVFKGLNGR